MDRIGVRELRQNASKWLHRVAEGECFEVTVRGELVALLSPPPADDDPLARLVARGILEKNVDGLSTSLDEDPPLPMSPPGVPTLSERLAELRRDER